MASCSNDVIGSESNKSLSKWHSCNLTADAFSSIDDERLGLDFCSAASAFSFACSAFACDNLAWME